MTSNPFDMRDVRRLQAHLARVVPLAQRDMRRVVVRAGMNIKRDWKHNARQTAPIHAPHYPRSISYDLWMVGRNFAEVEVGPDKTGPQGALGNLLEYGSVKNPPHNDGGRALATELPRFEEQIAMIVDRGLVWW